MTTIVWDGQTLAADRLITLGGHVMGHVVKIRRCEDGRLIGGCGELDVLSVFLNWLESGGDRPECMSAKSVADGVEIGRKGEVWFHSQHGRTLMTPGPLALGSGARYALAAIACGKTAVEAVKVAAKFDTCTGGRIDALTLKE